MEKNASKPVDLPRVAQTLLRIVARLPKTEYHEDKSNGQQRRQAEVLVHSDLPDPASDDDTSQG